MERLGWVFWRCWDSPWIADRDACVADLNMTLSRLGIEPIGMGEIDGIFTAHVEVSSPKSDTATLTLDLGVLDAQAPAPRDTAPPVNEIITLGAATTRQPVSPTEVPAVFPDLSGVAVGVGDEEIEVVIGGKPRAAVVEKIEGEGCAGTCGGLVGQVRDAEGFA